MTADDASGTRFTELLPWYLNGRLDEPDRRWVEDHLSRRPDAAAQLQRHREVQAAVQADPAALPIDLGWQDYASRHGLVDDAPARTAGPAPAPVPAPGLRWLPTRRPRLWAGAALVVLLVQGVTIVALLQAPERDAPFATQRSATPVAPDTRDLAVTFRPEATEAQIRRLLLGINARVVDGPTQAGEYRVRVPARDAEAARAVLQASPLASAVEQP